MKIRKEEKAQSHGEIRLGKAIREGRQEGRSNERLSYK